MIDRQELQGEEEAYLRLWVGYAGAPDARETGRIVERIANAFSQEMRGQGRGKPRLAITSLSIGSLLAELKAVFEGGSAILGILEQRELLGVFLQRIAVAIQVLKDANGGGVPASIRMLLSVIVSPIAAGRASGAQLSVNGNNNIVIVIDRADATELHSIISALTPPSGGGGGAIGPIATFDRRTASFSNDQTAFSASEPYEVEYEARAPRYPRAVSLGSVPSLKFEGARGPAVPLTNVERLATAFPVDGEWYARAEGYGGSLLPIVFGTVDSSALDKACRYTVAGTIEANGQGGRFHLTRVGKRSA